MNVGLIGLKSGSLAWNNIDARMNGRTRVAAVWDAVAARTQIVEREGDRRDGDRMHRSPTVYQSISKLATRRALDACIVLDPAWTGLWSARRVADEGIPVLWLADWPNEEKNRKSPWSFGGVGRDLITPGLQLRYLPATLRLRELIATKLGNVEQVSISNGSNLPAWELADWSSWITGTPSKRNACEANVTFNSETQTETVATIRCEHGTGEWKPGNQSEPSSLRWQLQDRSEWTAVDTSRDRPPENVLLDLFFRRVAGGLIPLPSVDDVQRAIEIQ